MLLVGGLVLLVGTVGAVVLGVLLLGLWRRAVALLTELGELGERLERVRDALDPSDDTSGRSDLDEDLARLGERHPDVEILVRPRATARPGRSPGSRQIPATPSAPDRRQP